MRTRRLVLLLALFHGCWSNNPSAGFAEEPGKAGKSPVRIDVDFGQWIEYPLSKSKFGVYNSGYVPGYVKAYERDIHLFHEVRPDSLRFDGGLGAPRGILFSEPPMVSGSPPAIEYDFRQVDQWLGLLEVNGIRPYWSYSYIPENLVESGETFRHPPASLDAWGDVLSTIAAHLRDSDISIAYHEIFNEPDNRDFFLGNLDDYLGLYQTGVKAIRDADPEARVGGPALAFSDSWIAPFLDHVVENELPLDFFSFHYYPGNPYQAEGVRGVIGMVRDELDKRPELVTAEMHLNEYNSLPIHYPVDGPQQKHHLAAALLDDFAFFLSDPHLTKVHWAQFMDTAGGNWSGMISLEGRRKAVFNAYKIYARMPVDRRKVSMAAPPGVGAMASSDHDRSGLVVWNRSDENYPLDINLRNFPFDNGEFRVYRIDANHASWGDNPENEELVPVEVGEAELTEERNWKGDLSPGGVVYIEAIGETEGPTFVPDGPGSVHQVLYYYPDREKRNYADFDRNSWIARLGMGGEERADAKIGVVATQLSSEVRVLMEVDGKLCRLDGESLLGLQLDFEVDGEYAKSVLFHGPYRGGPALYSSTGATQIPWIPGAPREEVVRVADLAEFDLDLMKHAPSGWEGKALITFVLRNAGADVRVKVTLR